MTYRKSDSSCDEIQIPKKSFKITVKNGTENNIEWLTERDFTSTKKWEAFQYIVKEKNRLILNLQRRNRRMKTTVNNLKDLTKLLKNKNLLSTSEEEYLQASIDPGVKQLITGILQGKKYHEFPPNLKNFAMTLHFYSPSAYNFVRKSFLKILPHPSTLREWLRSVNHNPGISVEALESVARLIDVASKKNKKLFFNLTCDEMSIRKRVEWDGKEYLGYVDLGRNNCTDNDNAPEASNALVFILVCINDHFKIPVAYYFINALSGKEKSTLLEEIISECVVNNIEICNITFDGASSNISMVENFGVEMYEKTSADYFMQKSTQKPIFTTLDACHMLKLVRNALASKDITDSDGNVISWRYIKALVDIQEKEQLHQATKIRRRHVSFFNEKMKVNLAAQVLSRSVAKALENSEFDLEIDEFQGASATARFCQIINDSFDILNSRNIFNKDPSKHAITRENLEETKIRIRSYVNYLENLNIDDTPVIRSPKRTGFLGLIKGMQNVVELAEYLFTTGQMNFLLTYKLSQDHLETFFSCVRRFGGYNNNPTVRQFKSAYRKLLSHVSICVPLSANCIPKDDTLLMNDVEEHNASDETSNKINLDENELEVISNTIRTIELNEFVTDIIGYISGFVVRSIKKKIDCEICLKSMELEEGEGAISSLQRRKCRGKLTSASREVVNICEIAEKIFRVQNNFLEKNIVEKMVLKSIRMLPTSIFANSNHIFEQSSLADHRMQLIKLILNKYFQIRLHHDAASRQNDLNRIRMRNNKLTLFQNQ